MEEQGIVGPADGAKPRAVLVNSLDEVFGKDTASTSSGDEVYDDMPDEDSHIKVRVD
jgi:protein gp37